MLADSRLITPFLKIRSRICAAPPRVDTGVAGSVSGDMNPAARSADAGSFAASEARAHFPPPCSMPRPAGYGSSFGGLQSASSSYLHAKHEM